MSGRRKVRLEDASGWVFNRMADVYGARPAYPSALIDVMADLAGAAGARVLDVGAGVGHLALPLARRGLALTAIEPAQAMLERLHRSAAREGRELVCLQGSAESMPVADGCFELAVIADALHFMDAALTGAEVARVLVPRGCLAIVTNEWGDTPFMRGLVTIMEESAPRRPRAVTQALTQVAALAGVALDEEHRFHDETPVSHETLERILQSISFIGPAMNAQRFATFQQRVRALSSAPVWARSLSVRAGRRGG